MACRAAKFRCLYRRKSSNIYQNYKPIYPLIQQSHLWEFIPQNLQKQSGPWTSLYYKREETTQESPIGGWGGDCAFIPWNTLQLEGRMKRPQCTDLEGFPNRCQVKNARLQTSVKRMFLLREKRIYILICLLLHKETLQSHLRN